MDYNPVKRVIQELFRDNLQLYPEYYPLNNLEQSHIVAKQVAQGYWKNRTDEEIERDTAEEITEADYIEFCYAELDEWIEEQKQEE